MSDVNSIRWTNDIWYIGIQCNCDPSNIPAYRVESHYNGYEELTSEDLQEIKHVTISFALYETSFYWDFTKWVTETLEYFQNSNIFPNLKTFYILYDQAYVNFSVLPDHYDVYGHQIKWLLLRTDEYERKTINVDYDRQWLNQVTQRTKDNYSKAFWLVGDIKNRVHKFPLLYKFYINNQLHLLDYSLTTALFEPKTGEPCPDRYKVDPLLLLIMQHMYDQNLNEEKLLEIYHSLERELPGDDGLQLAREGTCDIDVATYYFPPQWNDADLIIMPDTFYSTPTPGSVMYTEHGQTGKHYWEHNDYHPMTEKPWKPIATKKPFINISYRDSVAKTLENFGYRTFLKYTDYPEFITGPENLYLSDVMGIAKHHVDITHKRICSFLKNINDNRDKIQEDIEFNYEHHKNVINQEWNLLYQHCPPLKKIHKAKLLSSFGLCLALSPPTRIEWGDDWLRGWV